MLSVLLSVEELELPVIRHVFENRLHFLALVAHFSLNFCFIIIKPWFQSFVISSSPTSMPSFVAASSSTIFIFHPEQKMY
jgi:hypothetical protein